jgi:hypothetical protein
VLAGRFQGIGIVFDNLDLIELVNQQRSKKNEQDADNDDSGTSAAAKTGNRPASWPEL